MVQWQPGERITASKLSVTQLQAVCVTAMEPTTTETEIDGCSITFTTTRDDVQVTVIGVADIESVGVSADGFVIVRCQLDGVSQAQEVVWQGNGDENRGTCTGVWTFVVDQGPHTVSLTGDRSGGADGENRINATHTTITAIIEDSV